LRGYYNVVLIDASSPLEKVVAAAERAIVDHLETRTAERLHLPLAAPKNPFATEVLLFFCRRHIPVLSRFVRILYNSDIYCRLPAHIYMRSEEHTSELQSRENLVCRLLLEKKKQKVVFFE